MRPISTVLIFVCFSQLGLYAQVKPPEQATVEQAVQEALEKNLSLLAEKYNVTISEARLITARLRPNPVFSYGSDYLDVFGAGYIPTKGVGPAEFNFRTDFLFELGGKRARRIESAEGARSVAELQLLNSTRLLTLDVQNACVDILLAKETLTLAQENLKDFSAIVTVNSARVQAGDLAQVELVRSRVAELQFQNAVIQAESRLRLAGGRLRLLLSRPITSDLDIIGDLRRDLQPMHVDELRRAAMDQRPDLQAMIRDQARSLSDLKLQIAQGKVDLTVGAEFHRQYGGAVTEPGSSLGLFVSLPLPVFNRNQGEIERARQEQRQIAARIEALQSQIGEEVQGAYQQYQTSRQLLESIERDMLDQAKQVRQTTEYSYRRGEASFVEFLDAQRAFNDTVQSYNEARAEFARSLYLLDSISGKAGKP